MRHCLTNDKGVRLGVSVLPSCVAKTINPLKTTCSRGCFEQVDFEGSALKKCCQDPLASQQVVFLYRPTPMPLVKKMPCGELSGELRSEEVPCRESSVVKKCLVESVL